VKTSDGSHRLKMGGRYERQAAPRWEEVAEGLGELVEALRLVQSYMST
jgi:hypothetical protein